MIALSFQVSAQVFKKGTITLPNGEKKEAYIHFNYDNGTPQTFKTKDNNGKIIKMDAWSVNSFEKENESNEMNQFFTKDVIINRSTFDLDHLENSSRPKLSNERLFLEKIFEGKISLYLYQENNINVHYFVEYENKIEELIKKTYRHKDNDGILENNQYRVQLLKIMSSKPLLAKEIMALSYNEIAIISLLKKYLEVPESKEYKKSAHTFAVGLFVKGTGFDRKYYDYFGISPTIKYSISLYRNVFFLNNRILYNTIQGRSIDSKSTLEEKINLGVLQLQETVAFRSKVRKFEPFIEVGLNLGNVVRNKSTYSRHFPRVLKKKHLIEK